MGKFKYTKEELEILVYKQLANLEALGRRIQLLEKQNDLLLKYNHRLMEELSDRNPPIPYKTIQRKSSDRNSSNLAAED